MTFTLSYLEKWYGLRLDLVNLVSRGAINKIQI